MIIDKLLYLMAEKSASDIFISVGSPIQMKLSGTVRPINQQVVSQDSINKIVDEMLSPAQAERFRLENELNISLSRPGVGNFRVNLFRQRHSAALVVRHVPYDIPPLASLSLPSLFSEVVLERRGLILIVGSTGSGKSTTLASMLDYRINNVSGHVLTVEDPIEFLFKHNKSIVNQREIGIDTASWESALKNAMRQSPDCIMIGEIRDKETMSAAITYSLTGHLCIATLHANNTYHALNRITSFFAPEARGTLQMDLSVSLNVIISQRLLRGVDGGLMPTCEILKNDTRIAELIQKGDLVGIKETMNKSQSTQSVTFEQDLLRLVRSGKVSREEAIAFADSPTDLMWQLNSLDEENAANSTKAPSLTVTKDASPVQEASFEDFKLLNTD